MRLSFVSGWEGRYAFFSRCFYVIIFFFKARSEVDLKIIYMSLLVVQSERELCSYSSCIKCCCGRAGVLWAVSPPGFRRAAWTLLRDSAALVLGSQGEPVVLAAEQGAHGVEMGFCPLASRAGSAQHRMVLGAVPAPGQALLRLGDNSHCL